MIQGTFSDGETVTATVTKERRQGIQRAHSATHILHWALQRNLGTHAQQQGSKVDDDWLRFDFTNLEAVGAETLQTIEKEVREQVAAGGAIKWETLPLAEARAAGAMMLFGEKYPDPVRMVSIGDFSKELCGGTHLTNAEQVGQFEVLSEEGVSAGTRRLTALTGKRAAEHRTKTQSSLAEVAKLLDVADHQVPNAVAGLVEKTRWLKKQASGGGGKEPTPNIIASSGGQTGYAEQRKLLRDVARQLNVQAFDVPDRIKTLLAECESLQKQNEAREAAGGTSVEELVAGAKDIGGAKAIIVELPMAGTALMRQLVDQIRKQLEPTVILFASKESEDKVTLIAAVSRDLVKKVSAGNWVKEVAPIVGGGGGGKPDMAQAGGKKPENIPQALTKAEEWIAEALGA